MATENHNIPNPSEWKKSEALENAMTELHGAASVACLVLLALRDDVALPPGEATKAEAIAWMEKTLSAASENAQAIYHQRAPSWRTLGELTEVQEELDALRKQAAVRAAE